MMMLGLNTGLSVPLHPSPLREGTEGGGAEAATHIELAASSAPPPLTPPLKGEGNSAGAFQLGIHKD